MNCFRLLIRPFLTTSIETGWSMNSPLVPSDSNNQNAASDDVFPGYMELELARLYLWLSLEPSDSPGLIADKLKESEQALSDFASEFTDQPQSLPLPALQKVLGLTREELDFLVCCLAPSMDEKFLPLFAKINPTNRPNVSAATLSRIFRTKGPAWRNFCFGDNPLLRFDLLFQGPSPEYNASELVRPLRPHKRLISFVYGQTRPTEDASEYLSLQAFKPDAGVRFEYSEETQRDLKHLGRLLENLSNKVLFQFTGAEGVGKSFAALGLCEQAGLNVLRLNIRKLLSKADQLEPMLRRISRECLILQAALLVPDWHLMKEQEFVEADLLLERLQAASQAVILTSETPFSLPRKSLPVIEISFESADYSKRMLAWQAELSGTNLCLPGADRS